MAISKKVEEILNKQINAEFWSAYFYLSMSNYFNANGMPGFANWMKVQFQEETSHAMKMTDYVNERNGRVILEPIKEVPSDWNDVLNIFEETLKHEEYVTTLINGCVNVAIEEKDHASVNFMQWFVDEQVEEEATVSEIIDQLRMFEGKGHGLYMMDKEFKARVFVDSTQV
ncbi:ferritin [Labilibaculum sp. A4]|uniref:Ferritin n=1 Tax=Labilibaculum euxinus TaxID=2686357 RepID=A0A425YG02_9BACT|nr:ferritin [Labilibaculum euxinus]MDQ1770322.1 ferritin [Labilibaculum euxinus]MUP37954.1 ferritin [Labilibaculum euxinus]MVB07159.1 ferritin [Labilibaculum euxinus]MWN75459.1 ferritin [Labilibaculum euxinus]